MDDQLLFASESVDIAAWSDLVSAAPQDFAERHALRVVRIGSAVQFSSIGLGLSHVNSAIGLGLGMPATRDDVGQIVSTFEESTEQFTIVMVPHARPEELGTWLSDAGLHPAGCWDRMILEGAPMRALTASREMAEPVSGVNGLEWATFIDRAYDLGNAQWLMSLVGRPGWRHYVLRDAKGAIAAARSMFIDMYRRAWLGLEAPVPGIMSERYDRDFSLCARALGDGLRAGAASFHADIAKPDPERSSVAYEGFARLGFEPAYLRTQWTAEEEEAEEEADA